MKHLYVVFLLALIAVFSPLAAQAGDGLNESPYIPTILIVEDDEAASELESCGVIIWRRRADMALALVPRSMQLPARVRGKVRIESGRRAQLCMDKARPMYGADRIQLGEGLPQPYTGKGVVVGLCDVGIDPNHIAFLDENGMSRVKRIVRYDEPNGIREVIDTPEQIAAWSSDNGDEYHGTHVANIMAGGYNGSGFGGMAPGAEIVAASSKLYDAGILSACEDIIDYAKEVGKPAVINLSLSNYNGPHDGTSLFCRYMDLLGEEAIVLLASGNAGNYGLSKHLNFTETMPEWRVRMGSTDWSQFRVAGYTDAWSADASPIGVQVLVYDDNNNRVVYKGEEHPFDEPFEYSISSMSDHKISRYISGEIKVRGGISPLNGRWVTEMEYDTSCSKAAPNSNGQWARYRIAFRFTANPGTVADITADGQYSWFNEYVGYGAPENDLSISDMCTGRNTISVGMYNSRISYPMLSGEEKTFPNTLGTVNRNSSYGTLADGRVFPHTVAPGAVVVSACSSHFISEHPGVIPSMCAESEVGGKKYYWTGTLGTSMSTPYTAGVVATWLEAVPTLTVTDIRHILAATNLHEYYNAEDPRNGGGWLQPYEGLKMALEMTGVANGSIDAAAPTVVFKGYVAEILNPGGTPLTVAIYGVDGRCVLPATVLEGRVNTLDVSTLKSGVYMITVQGTSTESLKFIRR